LSWQLNVIANHGLDKKEGLRIEPLELAGAPAAQLALQAGPRRSDRFGLAVGLSAAGRGRRFDLHTVFERNRRIDRPRCVAIRDVAGLAGQRLGIAGSALDKSWLVLRLFTRARLGLDLETLADKGFGAPPLLSEALQRGGSRGPNLLAVVAKLEARGMRRLLSIGDALGALGIPADPRSPAMSYPRAGRWTTKRLSMFSSRDATGKCDPCRFRCRMGTNRTAHRGRRSR